LAGLLSLALPGRADVLSVEPSADNTLYEASDGTLSNGAGEHLFAGVTQSGFARRAVLRFDLSALPPGAYVKGVTLHVLVSKVPFLAPSTVFRLHRLTSDWGEGASDALGEEGAGAPSEPGDATWIHTFYATEQWALAGGDFDPAPSAKTTAPGTVGPISWSAPGMVADVRAWQSGLEPNHGWLILAVDETTTGNAKRFDSRENPDPLARPRLEIEYDPLIPGLPPTDACPAAVYCDAHPANVADISADTCVCAGNLSIVMAGAPPGRFGYLLVGSGTAAITDPPGALGELCLGGAPVGRFALDVGLTDGAGSLATDILHARSGGGNGGIPTLGGSFCAPPGQTWNFQYWYRDQNLSRFSNALTLTLR